MSNALFVSVYPGPTDDMKHFVVERMAAFFVQR
jgi:hypothetical protein